MGYVLALISLNLLVERTTHADHVLALKVKYCYGDGG